MKKRSILINFRLTEEEVTALTRQAKECGYSREAYIRSLLKGYVPQAIPPPTYHDMMKELNCIGNNLNQISQKANILNVIDVSRYDAAMRMFSETVAKIEKAVILPVKMT